MKNERTIMNMKNERTIMDADGKLVVWYYEHGNIFIWGILLRDIAKRSNMLLDTAKSKICPVPL